MALVFYQVTGANQLAAVPGLSQTLTTPLLDGALGQLAEPLMSGSCETNRQLDPNLPHYVAGLRYRRSVSHCHRFTRKPVRSDGWLDITNSGSHLLV